MAPLVCFREEVKAQPGYLDYKLFPNFLRLIFQSVAKTCSMEQRTLAPLMRSQCATDGCGSAQLHLQGTPAAVISYTQFNMQHYNIRSEM